MHDIAESMVESLQEDPDAAVLVTIPELDEDADAEISLFADHEDDEAERLARRLVAHKAGGHLAQHFPDETQHGAVKIAGGQWAASGAYMDPAILWERRHEDTEEEQ